MILAILKLIGWQGVLAGLILIAGAWWHFSAVSQAHERGVMQERIAWQEIQRREELKQLEKQRAIQAKINEIDHQLANERSQGERARDDFEAALEAERNENKSDRSSCALPDRVRNQLTAPGHK